MKLQELFPKAFELELSKYFPTTPQEIKAYVESFFVSCSYIQETDNTYDIALITASKQLVTNVQFLLKKHFKISSRIDNKSGDRVKEYELEPLEKQLEIFRSFQVIDEYNMPYLGFSPLVRTKTKTEVVAFLKAVFLGLYHPSFPFLEIRSTSKDRADAIGGMLDRIGLCDWKVKKKKTGYFLSIEKKNDVLYLLSVFGLKKSVDLYKLHIKETTR